MLKKLVRTSVAAAVMLSTVAMSTAASAESIRPGQSLVSARPAAASAMPAQPVERAGAPMVNANMATTVTWVLTFIAVGTIIVAIWVAVESDDEPESP